MSSQSPAIKTLLKLISIDSPSGEEQKVAEYIMEYLQDIDIPAEQDAYGNVIARVPGKGEPFILEAHMDTVEPGRNIKPQIKEDWITPEGETILGADDKAGISLILETVRKLKEHQASHRPLELIFTREEEQGGNGASNLDFSKIQAQEGVSIDGDAPPGNITMAAPFIYLLDINIKGKAAHGGVCPEKGINSIQVASHALSKINIGRINNSTTLNIGTINGGTAFNAVPENTNIKGDVRSHFLEEADEQVEKAKSAFQKAASHYGATPTVYTTLGATGFSLKEDDPLVEKIKKANQDFEFNTVYERTGGVLDANTFAAKNIKIVDISHGGRNAHTTQESLNIPEFNRMEEYLFNFITSYL